MLLLNNWACIDPADIGHFAHFKQVRIALELWFLLLGHGAIAPGGKSVQLQDHILHLGGVNDAILGLLLVVFIQKSKFVLQLLAPYFVLGFFWQGSFHELGVLFEIVAFMWARLDIRVSWFSQANTTLIVADVDGGIISIKDFRQ